MKVGSVQVCWLGSNWLCLWAGVIRMGWVDRFKDGQEKVGIAVRDECSVGVQRRSGGWRCGGAVQEETT